MGDIPRPTEDQAGIALMPPPGLARRRLMRAAGVNLTIDDFTDEERAVRGFPARPAATPPAESVPASDVVRGD
jgi:hypothetical protein